MAMFPASDADSPKKMREIFGPGHIDEQIRQAIHFCWMLLPDDRKTFDELEMQMRRIVDRAFKDFREDFEAFGLEK